jgi:hypothetical protein
MSGIVRVGWALALFGLMIAQGGWALAQEEAAEAAAAQVQPGEPLGAWATAAFIWLVLFLAMAFVVAMGWLSRSRRY